MLVSCFLDFSNADLPSVTSVMLIYAAVIIPWHLEKLWNKWGGKGILENLFYELDLVFFFFKSLKMLS